jgi:hypothetical protein
MFPKTLRFLCLLALSACSQPPEDTNSPEPTSSASASTTPLSTIARLVIPPGVAYTDAYGGLAVSDKPLLISHLCIVPASQRRFLTPGASPVQDTTAVASWWAGKASAGAETMAAWLDRHTEEGLKWLAVEAMVYCKPSEFYYGNGVTTAGGQIAIDEATWTKLGGK